MTRLLRPPLPPAPLRLPTKPPRRRPAGTAPTAGWPPSDPPTAPPSRPQAELAAGETRHRIFLRAYEYAETDPRRQQTLRLGAAFADSDFGEAAHLVSRWFRRGRIE